MPRYAEVVYNGYWWSPERRAMQALIDETQGPVNGDVRLKLYKGNVTVLGRRRSEGSLFDEKIATFEEDEGAYDQKGCRGLHQAECPAPAYRGVQGAQALIERPQQFCNAHRRHR